MSERINRREFAGLVGAGVALSRAKTVVLSNTGAARKTRLRLGNLMTEVSLPANSVTNLSWV